jgi:hypothetical protein
MKMAPEYWIASVEGFKSSMAIQKYSGFLQNLQDAILNNKSLINLNALLEIYESLIPSTDKVNKTPMLSLYFLYNNKIMESGKRLNYEQFLDKYQSMLNECSIETMIVRLLINQKWGWDIGQCILQYENYKKNKFQKESLSIPLYIELCLIIEIANIYLRNQKNKKYEEWLNCAYLESAGKPEIQKMINEYKIDKKEIGIDLILKPQKTDKVIM